ncbi:BRO-N domain-containing protein [Phascolarctobacterium faecium]|uniref:BRO-N domain-containing protein n=1 Tax=Phascolarctobacterium faecium TaxID=33025 RepID=UPI003FD828E8
MSNIKLFQSKQIRSVWNEEEQQWYFSVVDVVGALTDSSNPTDYLKKMRKRDSDLGTYIGTNCPQVNMLTDTGKNRRTLAATTKGILRIIQSIPSPKAEPFKQWLAQVGSERIAEIENPELAQKRIRDTYRAKGYSDEWIEQRIRGIAIRDTLTDEWKKRGIKEGKEYAILTAEISKATFGITPAEYKKIKSLDRPTENLRDHMTDLELLFSALGEASTTEIAKTHDAYGMQENTYAAKAGGKIAGDARKALEKKTGRTVISKTNYKELQEKDVRKRLKETDK